MLMPLSYHLNGQDTEIIETGAEQIVNYMPVIRGNNIGVVANHTSMVRNVHLIDTLISLNTNIVRIFCPEHGFRGNADAGEEVKSGKDPETGIPIVSLYGNSKKPTVAQLEGIEFMLFDLQDVGVRYYTYISTLHYVMEACAQNGIPLVILDRPNPNGHYIDGPILEPAFKSFVGMHPVPIVHGMTIAEYAQMINGEGWLANGITCSLMIIKCRNYEHNTRYMLPVPPSPNLKSMLAVYLYPSTCLFEGTSFSLGRGTNDPFTLYGHPDYPDTGYSFTPESMPGAKSPPHLGKKCYGVNIAAINLDDILGHPGINLSYIADAYSKAKDKSKFFTAYFDKLAGNSKLKTQIRNGLSEEQIRETWKTGLRDFQEKRTNYLLYRDFQ